MMLTGTMHMQAATVETVEPLQSLLCFEHEMHASVVWQCYEPQMWTAIIDQHLRHKHAALHPEQTPLTANTASVLVSTTGLGSNYHMLSAVMGQVAIPSAEALLAFILGTVHQGAGSPRG